MYSRSYISSPTMKKETVTFLKTSLHFIFQTPNLFQDYSLIVLRPNKRPLRRETTSALFCFESCLFVLICICDPALLCLKNKCKASAYGYVICSLLIFSSSVTVWKLMFVYETIISNNLLLAYPVCILWIPAYPFQIQEMNVHACFFPVYSVIS